jgi:hypothetical protein
MFLASSHPATILFDSATSHSFMSSSFVAKHSLPIATGKEFVGVMPTVQGFVRCDAGSLWIVIIPKSKDRFMERPPMKIVQP